MAKKKTLQQKENATNLCLYCKNAHLMRSLEWNPIVALCKILQERFVASSHLCKIGEFQLESDIIINPMIKAN
jgi:hypothetical protein